MSLQGRSVPQTPNSSRRVTRGSADDPPTRFDLSGRADLVCIATQQWALEPWDGEDPPELGRSWAIKPKFAVNGNRSCAELAIVHHLRDQGWQGVWVCAYWPRELRTEWFRLRQSRPPPRP